MGWRASWYLLTFEPRASTRNLRWDPRDMTLHTSDKDVIEGKRWKLETKLARSWSLKSGNTVTGMDRVKPAKSMACTMFIFQIHTISGQQNNLPVHSLVWAGCQHSAQYPHRIKVWLHCWGTWGSLQSPSLGHSVPYPAEYRVSARVCYCHWTAGLPGPC
jgi:hypothetical protein